MPPHAQTTHHDFEGADASNVGASCSGEIDAGADTIAEDSAATIAIELNFNAFADNCPPTRHATRVAGYGDPSVQDFADQALEIAALRAELKRLHRSHDVLQHQARLRDARLETLRCELASAQAQFRNTTHQLGEARSQLALISASATQVGAPTEREASSSNERLIAREPSSTLEAPISHAEGSATIPSMPPLMRKSQALPLEPGPQLIPVDHDGNAVLLRRDVITIGRTRKNDLCIPSRAVSRDHARLLMSAGGVSIFDMDSANGCFVNDEPVKRQKLRDGDLLRIGDRSYRFANQPSG